MKNKKYINSSYLNNNLFLEKDDFGGNKLNGMYLRVNGNYKNYCYKLFFISETIDTMTFYLDTNYLNHTINTTEIFM